MVDISPGTALLVALQNQFNASRANAPQGNLGAGVPSLTAQGPGEGTPGSPGGLAAGSVGGGVPTTGTSGQSIANALSGGGAAFGSGDPLAQQVGNFLNERESFSGFGPPAPGTAEGDISPSVLLALASGNPLAMALAVSRAVSSQGEFDTIGGSVGEDFSPGILNDTLSGSPGVSGNPLSTPSSFRTLPNLGRLEGFSGNTGSGLSRGDISNAGR